MSKRKVDFPALLHLIHISLSVKQMLLRMSGLFLGIHNIVDVPKQEEKVGTKLRGEMKEPRENFFPFGNLHNKMVLKNLVELSRLRVQLFLLQSYLSVWNFLLPKVTNKYNIAILMKNINNLSFSLSHTQILLGQNIS